MATLTIKGVEFELKFSIMLDKLLNKKIKDENDKNSNKVSGGIAKALPQLIDMDVETLAIVFQAANELAPKERAFKASFDEVLEAIDERMNEDGSAEKIFADVFEAIDNSAFSRNQLEKFGENMNLIKEMRSDDINPETAALMVKRLNNNFEKITGKVLVEADETVTLDKAV